MKRFSFLSLILLCSLSMGIIQADSSCCTTDCSSSCSTSCSSSCGTSCGTSCGSSSCDDCLNCHSYTIFKPRSIVMDGTLNLTSSNYFTRHPDNEDGEPSFITVNGTVFYQQTSDSRRLARYFFPNCKSSIVAREDGFGDVNSVQFGVIGLDNEDPIGEDPNFADFNGFASILEMHPKRKEVGGIINIFFNMGHWCEGFWSNFWADISIIPVHVRHDLHMNELNIGAPADPESPFGSMIEALTTVSEDEDVCGRFFLCSKKDTHLDDLPIRLGWDFWTRDDYQVGLFFMVTAPTSPRPCGAYIFEPSIGSGRHTGIGGGIRGDVSFWNDDYCCFTLMTELKYQYYLKKCERRAFDLCENGDWSRYLRLSTEAAPLVTVPGLECFCLNVEVKPRHQIDWWTAVHARLKCVDFEFGYNLWWRARESVCATALSEECEDRGVWDIVGATTGGQTAVTSSTSDISQGLFDPNMAPSDATFITLEGQALDIRSGTTPRALSHKVFAAFSFHRDVCEWPIMVGMGGAYEFGRHKGSVDKWALWLKGSVSFW